MKEITLTIKTTGSAFGDGNLKGEVARILENYAMLLRADFPMKQPLVDINGNIVGRIKTEKD